jgi:hypothetical protein
MLTADENVQAAYILIVVILVFLAYFNIRGVGGSE